MVNKVILIGNLGKDPEIKTFENGNSIANFSLATNETYKDKNGDRQTRTDWHNISVGVPGLVTLCQQYFKKGDPMYVEGKLRTREYEKEGQKRYLTEVQVDTIKFLPKTGDKPTTTDATSNSNYSSTQNSTHLEETPSFVDTKSIDDDLPF